MRWSLTAEERFWNKVAKGNENECWLWQGYLNKYGYGNIKVNGKFTPAHRFSYQLSNPDNLLGPNDKACHSCDNPPCVNPNHIWKGTHADNMHDMFDKGRGKKPIKGGSVRNDILTIKQVEEIRKLYADGEMNQTELAIIYGCSQPNIGAIVRGECWKDYPGPITIRGRPGHKKIAS